MEACHAHYPHQQVQRGFFRQAAVTAPLKGVTDVQRSGPRIAGDLYSSIVDLLLVQVLDGTLLMVAAWYDNSRPSQPSLRTGHALARIVAQW
jgi:hypothetical protein